MYQNRNVYYILFLIIMVVRVQFVLNHKVVIENNFNFTIGDIFRNCITPNSFNHSLLINNESVFENENINPTNEL